MALAPCSYNANGHFTCSPSLEGFQGTKSVPKTLQPNLSGMMVEVNNFNDEMIMKQDAADRLRNGMYVRISDFKPIGDALPAEMAIANYYNTTLTDIPTGDYKNQRSTGCYTQIVAKRVTFDSNGKAIPGHTAIYFTRGTRLPYGAWSVIIQAI